MPHLVRGRTAFQVCFRVVTLERVELGEVALANRNYRTLSEELSFPG